MSFNCGFATNSTYPVPVTPPRCTNFRQRPVRIALPIAHRSGVLPVLQSQRLRCAAHLISLIAILRLHLPSGSEAFWVLLALSEETR